MVDQHSQPDRTTPPQRAWSMVLSAMMVERERFIYLFIYLLHQLMCYKMLKTTKNPHRKQLCFRCLTSLTCTRDTWTLIVHWMVAHAECAWKHLDYLPGLSYCGHLNSCKRKFSFTNLIVVNKFATVFN